MNILYAIQGTGNGHLARAQDIVPELKKFGNLDLFVSGVQADIALPFPVKYKSKGLSFYFGKNGGIDFIKTLQKNSPRDLVIEINSFPVEKYDLVINDFEPISAWAAKKKDVPIVGLGHQASFLSKKTPRPKLADPLAEWIFKNYAPVKKYVGFHFKEYDKNIYTPVIRSVIRQAKALDKGHYTVYLPAYADEKLVKWLSTFPKICWEVFSKHCTKAYRAENTHIFPASDKIFVESMVNATGVLCGAGFETPAEAIYLQKKLMVVPMKHQYEQQCNAIALKKMGVDCIKKLKRKSLEKIEAWLDSDYVPDFNFPNVADKAVEHAIQKFQQFI
ncbi:MAG: glycosyltransferase family protein [Bacteroidota bacterium]